MTFNWTEEQNAIFAAGVNTDTNIVVDAKAGAAKTSTSVELSNRLPTRNQKFLAFNKSIATELNERLTVDASTFHSEAFSMIRQRMRGVRTDGYKLQDIVGDKLHISDYEDRAAVRQLIGLAKNHAVGTRFGPDLSAAALAELADEYDVTAKELPHEVMCGLAVKGFKLSLDDLKTIDFDDMLYIPLMMDWYPDPRDAVFIDEAQDVSPVQLALMGLFGKSSRIIAVGDPHQAIYAFRGAGTNAIPDIISKFNAEVYPLSVSFRCARRIISEAQQIVPNIRAREGAPDGIVERAHVSEPWTNGVGPSDLIVCRNNGPLIEVATQFLLADRPFQILSKFPKQLLYFVKGFECNTLAELRIAVQAWYDTELAAAEEENRWAKADRIRDRFDGVVALMSRSETLDGLYDLITAMSEAKDGPRLSTIHGAKGLEAPTTFFLRPELLPSKYATTEAQLQQEYNLRYVAITRAMNRLVYVEGV